MSASIRPPVRLLLLLAFSAASSAPAGASHFPGPVADRSSSGSNPAVHDALVSASPGDGDTLAVVPEVLRLLFTRAQNLELATVEMDGPAGPMDLGTLREHADSAALVLAPVTGAWSPGSYTVRWRIVGQDGHPVSGEYRFEIEEGAEGLPVPVEVSAFDVDTVTGEGAAGAGVSDRTQADGGFGVGSPAFVAVRWLTFAALVGVLGATAFAMVVLPSSGVPTGSEASVDARSRAASVGLASAGLVVVAAVARLVAQTVAVAGGFDTSAASTLLTSTVWGAGWIIQMVAGVVAVAAFAAARRGAGAAWAVAAAAAVALAFTPALSGHAVASGPVFLAVMADGLHVLAAGGWMGGLLLLVVAGLPAMRAVRGPTPISGVGTGPSVLAAIARAFSRSALVFAGLLTLTGVVAAWLHLGSLSALFSSGYGRTLLVKLAVLVPLIGTGAYNWLRVRPALESGDASAAGRLGLAGRVELCLAVVVLLVTAVLVATPPPAESAGAAQEVAGAAR